MSAFPVTLDFQPTPAQLAEAFWNMASDEQADFYAHLYRISQGVLCQQTAYLVGEIAKRQVDGDRDAVNGFRTLHSHAEEYLEVLVYECANRPFRSGVPA